MSEQSKQIKGLNFKGEHDTDNGGKVYNITVNPNVLFAFLKENAELVETYKEHKYVRVSFIPTKYGHMAVHNKYEPEKDEGDITPSTANSQTTACHSERFYTKIRMPNSKHKGNRFELETRKFFKALGWESCETSRLMSKHMDDIGIDLVNTNPFDVQCKHVEQSINTHEILLRMPDNSNYNLLFHKRNNKGVVVSMTIDDFKEILEMLISNEIIENE